MGGDLHHAPSYVVKLIFEVVGFARIPRRREFWRIPLQANP